MAARRNGWRTASDIDCDCRRSNAAAIGRANASVGSTRCQATSTIDVVQDASTVPADSIPPVGSHRVRAAMNTSISDMRSGGTEMHMTDVPRTNAESHPARRVPVKMPSPIPTSVDTINADTASTAVLPAALTTSGPTGRL